MGDEEIPVDSSLPNPNGIEFDKLYLDMNGIIHPCCHPEDRPAPATEDEMMIDIFEYIDRIFTMVRPRKLLYMAIGRTTSFYLHSVVLRSSHTLCGKDGVAPRAKMNQQRSRRFRAAQEERIKRDDEERLRKEWEKAGETLPQAEEKKERFDSNCITPGTPFMARLADCLKYYVIHRLNNDPGWANVTVLLSDASVPGEGEHKIMDYIRRERNTEGYDPNVQHVLYGLDADLIMLALATHEPHFRVLREDVFFGEGRDRKCFLCGQPGHMADSCTGEFIYKLVHCLTKLMHLSHLSLGKKKEKIGDFDEKTVAPTRKPYVFLHIPILREYLAVELSVPSLPFSWSLERSIDDWVFMCFFVGNDFLPHLPSLEIREGAIDTLIGLWKKHLAEWGGYLTDSGDIALERVEKMMEGLGHLEDGVFRKRRDIEDRKRKARMDRKRQAKERQGGVWTERPNPRDAIPAIVAAASTTTLYEKNVVPAVRPSGGSKQANKAAAELLKASLLDVPKMTPKPVAAVEVEDVVKNATIVIDEDVQPHGTKRRIDEVDLETASDDADEAVIEVIDEDATAPVVEIVADDDDDEAPEEVDVPIPDPPKPKKKDDDEESEPDDNVRLWETGWKERYYTNKFDVTLDNAEFRKSIVHSYVEGLCWVLKYYYQGVQSWKWYYPYHYSPFASDFGGTGEFKITFEIGTPFKPIEQLMGVLPADSNKHIPAPFRPLMEQEDSPIYDFYPVQFPIDMNGKKHAWQGIEFLNFVDIQWLDLTQNRRCSTAIH